MHPIPAALAASLALVGPSAAQSFADVTSSQLPSSPPNANLNSTENIDFADVDLDGDFDVLCADGGSLGNDRNRLWINQGGAQGGTLGVFLDQTASQYPNVVDTSRDVDFADIDSDGDPDVVVSNVSELTNQSNQILVNQGGAQGGTAGFFVNETSARWVNLGVNDGVTSFSSIFAGLVLANGGFLDWSGDAVLGDLDGDGDLDLLHSSHGPPAPGLYSGDVPHRIFLNDGQGYFEEFNPSGFQLTGQSIANGDPALWASGVHQQETLVSNGSESDVASTAVAVELGDLDGDFDLDFLIGALSEQPRIFRNELSGGNLAPFVDVTHSAFSQLTDPQNNYEQELGDFDGDNDLDIYGVNWGGSFAAGQLPDVLVPNLGGLQFGAFVTAIGSETDGEEADCLDYDGDGYLDVYLANFAGPDQLYENPGNGSIALTNVTATELPAINKVARGVDSADVDLDGDLDVLLAHDNVTPNMLLDNLTQVADAHPPGWSSSMSGPPPAARVRWPCGRRCTTTPRGSGRATTRPSSSSGSMAGRSRRRRCASPEASCSGASCRPVQARSTTGCA